MTPQAEAFAAIMTMLVDPRTSDDDLTEAAFQVTEETARHLLITLASLLSGYIEDDAVRAGVTVEQMMALVREEIREKTEASEQFNRKAGA